MNRKTLLCIALVFTHCGMDETDSRMERISAPRLSLIGGALFHDNMQALDCSFAADKFPDGSSGNQTCRPRDCYTIPETRQAKNPDTGAIERYLFLNNGASHPEYATMGLPTAAGCNRD